MAPNDYGPILEATAFTLTSISTAIVALRLYCNGHLLKRAGLSDVFVCFAVTMTWIIAIINYYQVKYGSGKHRDSLNPSLETLEGTLKTWYAFQIAYLIDLLCVKLSILCFYCTICDQRWFRTVVYSMMGIVGSFTVAMAFVNAFECPNPSDAFTIEIVLANRGSCTDLHSMYFAQAGFNIASDLVIMLIPAPLLLRLQMARSRQIAIFGVFGVGLVAVLASILRLWNLTIWAKSDDIPYSGAPILIWSQIELNVAIISASFPALRALFMHTLSDNGSHQRPSNGARYLKYSYGANFDDKAVGSNAKDSIISLRALSFIKGSGEARTSKSLARGSHAIRSCATGHSDEEIFFDEPVGQDAFVDSGKASMDASRDRSAVVEPLTPIFATHPGIMKSLTVEQTTEDSTGRPQYYRSHYLR